MIYNLDFDMVIRQFFHHDDLSNVDIDAEKETGIFKTPNDVYEFSTSHQYHEKWTAEFGVPLYVFRAKNQEGNLWLNIYTPMDDRYAVCVELYFNQVEKYIDVELFALVQNKLERIRLRQRKAWKEKLVKMTNTLITNVLAEDPCCRLPCLMHDIPVEGAKWLFENEELKT